MNDIPTECPTCGTKVIEGRTRCHACGQVFGEDNRCPHCHALAAAVQTSRGLTCAACGGPRERKEGTVVIGGGGRAVVHAGKPSIAPALGPVTATSAGRAGSAALRLGGMGSVGVGVMSAIILMLLLQGALGLALAILLGGFFVGAGALALRAGAKAGIHVDEKAKTARELQILELAEGSEGDLTVTEVSRKLQIGMAEADTALTAMADGSRVGVEVDPNGVVHYVFREIGAQRPADQPRVRVDPMSDRAELDEFEERLRASQEKKRAADQSP
ncbi:MAG: hypothetical protein AAGF12_07740 [Myxococcota bacterium]